MSSAAYTLQLIQSKQITLNDFEKAPNSCLPLAELYRWLELDKEAATQLHSFITQNCLGNSYESHRPCFKILLNSKDKPTLYIVEKAVNWFLTTYRLKLKEIGVSDETIETVIKRFQPQKRKENSLTVQNILRPFKKTGEKFKYHLLPRKVIEAMLKETIIDEQGIEKPLVYYITIANKMHPTIDKENMPILIEKYGQNFGLDEEMIQKIVHSVDLPEITKEMIDLTTFSKTTHSSDSFMHWFKNNAFYFFKEDFEGDQPTLLKAKTDNMTETICFNQNKIPAFIQKHKDLLIMHGFNPKAAQQILNEKQETHQEVQPFPCLLISSFAQNLGKATAFIPKLKEFILSECMDDMFSLNVNNQQEIQAPIFLYYKSFHSEKTLYVYEQGMPDFLNKHVQDLLNMGISFQNLNQILDTKKMTFSQKNDLWTLKDFYLHSFSPLSENEFNAVLAEHLNDTFHLYQKDGSCQKLNMFVQTPDSKNPIKVMTAALPIILNKTKDKLGLTNLDCDRIISLSLMDELPPIIEPHYFAKVLEIPPQNVEKFINLFKNPNNRAYRQYFPDRSKKVIPIIGYYRFKTYGLQAGLYKKNLPFCLKMLQDELIELGANPNMIQNLKQLKAFEIIPLIVSKHTIYHNNPFKNNPNRQKE